MCNDISRREVTDVLMNFREFFSRNPSEIAILFFVIRNEADEYIHLPDFWFEMMQVRGLPEMTYVHDAPNSTTPWPTLREMIRQNKVSFRFCISGVQLLCACFLNDPTSQTIIRLILWLHCTVHPEINNVPS